MKKTICYVIAGVAVGALLAGLYKGFKNRTPTAT